TYNFTTVVDDALMGITHVIRGDDHLSNTPRQIMVYEALGVKVPTFAHLSMILGPDGKKLSKRHGATSVQAFRDEGYLPEAMLNYMSLLGWSLDGETTIFDKKTLFDHFTLDRINKSPAVFDVTKLEWINSVYIKEMGASEFVDRAKPWIEKAGLATADEVEKNRSWYEQLYPLIAERVKKMTDLAPMIEFLFTGDEVKFDEKSVNKVLKKEGAPEMLDALADALGDEGLNWDAESIETALRALPEKMDVKPRKLFQVARVAITGTQVSPPLFGSIALLTRQNCLARISAAKALC
ncbi:MAG: glutamate--tRNA ligase, partial [Coriobacteriales bacterium]